MSDVAQHDHPPWSPLTDPTFWWGKNGIWINQLENAPVEYVGPLAEGYDWITVKISHGLEQVFDEKYEARIIEYKMLGLSVVAWTWVTPERVAEQTRLAAILRRKYGFDALIVNAEKCFDGTGLDGKWDAVAYARTRQWLGGWMFDCPLAVSPEPRSAMDHRSWQDANAVYMPQAYPLENHATVSDVVDFGLSVGWEPHQIIPLCQVYKTEGKEYPAAEHHRRALDKGVSGVVLYTGDQSFDRPQVWRQLIGKE